MTDRTRMRGSTWDAVDEAVDETFPASDPSAGTLGRDRSNVPPADSDREEFVAGIFTDEAAVSQAIEHLVEAHFDAERDIRIVVGRHRHRHEVPMTLKTGVRGGAALGPVLGLVIGAVLAMLIAGRALGVPIWLSGLVADPLPIAGLKGALIGLAVGHLFGVLGGIGLWRDRARFDVSNVRPGTIWVEVRAIGDRMLVARNIMRHAGARHFHG